MVRLWLALTLLFVACTPKPADPCRDVSCGAGQCAVLRQAPVCVCDPGFVADGLSCVVQNSVIDRCASSPCRSFPGSVCESDGNSSRCVCPASKVEVGGSCVVRTPCMPNPCTAAHESICDVINDAASCSCEVGYGPSDAGCVLTPRSRCTAAHDAGDVFEPDECAALAHPIAPRGMEVHTLAPAGDHDWFRAVTTPGRLYSFKATSNAQSAAVLLELFDATGTTVLASDTRAGLEAELRFEATAALQLVRVRGFQANDVPSYSVVFTDLGLDDFADTSVDAVHVSATSRPFEGVLEVPGDVDVAVLDVPARRTVRVSLAPQLGSSVRVGIATPDGGTRFVGAGQEARVWSPQPSQVVLSVAAYGAPLTGPFSVSFDDLGDDDHADDFAFAERAPTDGGSVAGVLERADDQDAFGVGQQQGHVYVLSCSTANRGLWLTDNLGNFPLPCLGGNAVWLSRTTDDRFIRVAADAGAAAPFSFKVEDVGVDDFPDSDELAIPLAAGAVVSARLELANDIDWFSVRANQGDILEVTVTSPSNQTLQIFGGVDLSGMGVHTIVASKLVTRPEVISFSVSKTGPAGYVPYTVVARMVLDDHGDTPATATALQFGVPTNVRNEYAGDVDYVSFNVLAGHLYDVACSSGPQLESDAGMFSFNTFTATADGVVNLRMEFVRGLDVLTVTDLGLDDAGDTEATARALSVPAVFEGFIRSAVDRDVFSISVVPNHAYRITASPSPSFWFDVALSNEVDVVYLSSVSKYYSVHDTAPLIVTVFGQVVGPYTLSVTDLGYEDSPQQGASNRGLQPGVPLTVSLNSSGDNDVFALATIPGHLYAVESSAQNAFVNVETASSSNIYAGYFRASNEPHFCRVRASDELAYTITLIDHGADDHGDDRPTATALPLDGGLIFGRNEAYGDVDAFTFTPVPGQFVELEAVMTGTRACGVAVYQPGHQVQRFVAEPLVPLGILADLPGQWLVTVEGEGCSYGLSVTVRDDDFLVPTPITLGTRTGSIDFVGDTDIFRLPVTANTTLYMTLSANVEALVTGHPAGDFVLEQNETLRGLGINANGTLTFQLRSTGQVGSPIPYTLTLQ